MLRALRRSVLRLLGVVSREEFSGTTKGLLGAVNRNSALLAKRLDRLDQRFAELNQKIASLETVARTGRLRKIDDNVDALIRHAFLNGGLPEPQAMLARRFRGLSQHEEDGIIVALFDRIGADNRRFIEIGAGVNGGNSGFLARECGWTGLMLESAPGRARRLQRRFAPVVHVVAAHVTRENINELVTAHGLAGDIDLLSIDIDGIDYWVWEHLSVCRPRVVVVEYNPLFGTERAVTVPYDPQFNRREFDVPLAAYYGASLPALATLGARKGYRLALLEPRGVNAFFVRDDLARDLPPLTVERLPIAPELVADFGPEGVFPVLARAGLALIDV
jgi:hypothetical protein